MKIINLFCLGIVEDESGLNLFFILIGEPGVDENMLGHHQFRGFSAHGTRIVPNKENHRLGFVILFLGEYSIDPIVGGYQEIMGIHMLALPESVPRPILVWMIRLSVAFLSRT